jgi:hypothetical protein
MSRAYIRLLAVAAFMISATGATFSIFGLARLFSGAQISVAIMASALEFSKLVVTGFLYRYWGHVPKLMRAYLTLAVIVLVSITSMGIFGFLSSAYQQSSMKLHADQIKLTSLEADNQSVVANMTEIQRFIDQIPNSHITKKLQFRKQYETELRRLRKQSDDILQGMSALRVDLLTTQAKIGPIIYFAQAIHADPEDCVKWLIFLFVSVFDPLAVCLVFSLNLAIRLREKYRGNEMKIAGHSLSTPVDHRHKRAS